LGGKDKDYSKGQAKELSIFPFPLSKGGEGRRTSA
jgi:hypothetical protein